MRAPQIVRDFFEWRWAPCVALIVGSLSYVGLAVLIIPSQIDSNSGASGSTTPFNAPTTSQPNTAFASSLTPNSVAGNVAAREALRRPPSPTPPPQPASDTLSLSRRGFSPPIEQPEVPPPPPPPPPAPTPMPQLVPPPQPAVNIPPPQPPQEPAVQPPAAPPPAPGDESAPPQ